MVSCRWNLPTLVGKYINLDCYRSNCEAEETISLDMSAYMRLSLLLHISSCRYTGNVQSYYAVECNMYSELGK